MKCLKVASLICLSLLLANCALFSRTTVETTAEVPDRPITADTAQASSGEQKAPAELKDVYATIFFLRSSVVASAVSALLYEVVDGGLSLVGNIENNIQLAHKVVPGEHIFMLISGNSVDYIQVRAAGDKTYYSLVKPKMGAWKPSFSFFPIKSKLQADKPHSDHDIFFNDEEVAKILSAGLPVVASSKIPEELSKEGSSKNEEALLKHQESWSAMEASSEKVANLKFLEAAPVPLPK